MQQSLETVSCSSFLYLGYSEKKICSLLIIAHLNSQVTKLIIQLPNVGIHLIQCVEGIK